MRIHSLPFIEGEGWGGVEEKAADGRFFCVVMFVVIRALASVNLDN